MIEVDFVKKIWIIILVCLFALLTLSAVSASGEAENQNLTASADDISILEINSNDIILTSMDEVDNESDVLGDSLSDNDDILSDGNGGTFTDLNNIINGDTTKTSITLKGDYVFDSEKDGADFNAGITISRSLTITADGDVSIDGNNLVRALRITPGNTVTITGITFKNCYSQAVGQIPGMGGAIFGQGVVHIDNCRFIDNTANYANGGAVCLAGYASTINNSYFEGNKAIKNPSNLQSGGAGAVFINANNTTISHSTFIKNVAGLNGGAIGSSGNHLENVTITNCTISNNTADGSAGGVGMQSKNFVISNSTFKYNEAKGLYEAYPGNGGGLVMRGWDSYAYNCTFIGNIAKQHGGAAFSTNTSYDQLNNNTGFELCTFTDNTAGFNGGAVDWASGATYGYIRNSIFTDNTANGKGGAVHWSGTNGIIANSKFINNKATGANNGNEGDGGAVIWTGSNGIARNCTFINNNASRRGGAVYLQESATTGNCTNTTFDNCTFDANFAGTNGGAIDWHEGAHDGNLLNCIFENNIAKANGGAVYWRGHGGEIINSNFTNNTAKGLVTGAYGNTGDGGAIFWAGLDGVVDNCRFVDNQAIKNVNSDTSGRGGAVYIGSCNHGNRNITIKNSFFSENNAGTNGGAIDWFSGAHDGIVQNVTFESNIANRSGGAIFWNGHNGTIKDANFTNNRALGITNATSVLGTVTYGGDGGAVMWSGALGTVENARFINNTAAKRGGAVFLQSAESEPCENTTFKDSYFENNLAGTNGGAIDWNDGAKNGLVQNVTFVNNTAKRSGGAIFWHGQNGTIKHSKFDNNRATGEYWEYSYDLNMSEGDVILCTALPELSEAQIGKLYALNQSISNTIAHFESWVVEVNSTGSKNWKKLDETNVQVSESIISPVDWAIDQYYGGDGGTILWSGDIGLVENCTFIDSNSARRGGGAYMTGSDYVTYKDCYFENCTSGTNGGGVDWLAGANYGKIYNCIFNNTRAARSAGAIYYDGWYGEMENITVIGTKSWGGSLSNSSDGKVKYAGWDSSHWDTNTTGGDAGAIMYTGSYITVKNATFINCTSVGRGGAVFLQDNHNVTFELCVFENNYAMGVANNTWENYTQERNESNDDTSVDYKLTGHGGAVAFDVNAKNCKIIDSNFTANLARRNGGAVNFDEGSTNNTIINCSFDNNTVYDDGGAINFDHGSDFCSVYNSTFYNNTGLGRFGSTTKGGTICLTGSNITISGSEFILGAAYANVSEGAKIYQTDGGALFITGNYVNITDSSFDSCFTPNFAGAIKIIGNFTLLDNCTFINCTAPKYAGAVYVEGNSVLINNSNFSACTSEIAGAIYIAGNHSNLINSYVTNCSSSVSAGGVQISGNNADINGTKFVNCNTTGTHGGAICISGDNVTVIDSSFVNSSALYWNNAADEGAEAGAMHISGDYARVINSTFTNSYATDDGGALSIEGHDCKLYNSTFTSSIAGDDGGAINWQGNNGYIYNITCINNRGISSTGSSNGGTIMITGNNVTLTDSSFGMSSAKISGGTIFATGNNVTIANSSFEKTNVWHNISSTGKTYANGGGAIYVLGNYSSIEYCNFTMSNGREGGVIYIQGHDVTIDHISTDKTYALNGGAIYVQGANATISNSNITRGNSSLAHGGAILVNGSNTNISACNITMCFAIRHGGAIFVDGINATIEKSFFAKNNASECGGTIYIQGNNADILTSTFMQSHAENDGGIIYVTGDDALINASSLMMSSASKNGGAIYIGGENTVIENSKFDKNNATISGGAIYITGDFTNITNSNFTIDIALTGNGGAIYVGGDNTTISGARSDITQSVAGQGGAIYISGENTTVKDANMMHSLSAKEGGAIYIYGLYAKIIDSNISMTTSRLDAGAVYIEKNNATISGSHFSMTNATKNGGAIYIKGDNAKITNSSFNLGNSLNTGTKPAGGGAIFATGSYSTVSYCNFTNNHVIADGGAIFWYGGSATKYNSVIGCIFTNNSADALSQESTRGGGAIYWSEGGSNGVVRDSEFYNNSVHSIAKADGGAVLWDLSYNGLIDNCIFDGNYITSTFTGSGDKWVQGGSLFLRAKSSYNITNCIFANSSSSSEAGAVYLSVRDFVKGSKIYVNNTTFINNKVLAQGPNINGGGAIQVKESSAVYFSNAKFINNTANQGGAISYLNARSADNYFYNCTFIGNTATNIGGGMWATSSTNYIYNMTFINNTAGEYGGGLYTNIIADYSNLTFINNHANRSGALYLTTATLINDMNFINNTAIEGGALYLIRNGVTVSDNNFTGNGALFGGAIYTANGNIYIRNNNFTNNTAQDGGAIYEPITNNGVAISDSAFDGNTANNGGAIYLGSKGYDNRYVTNCNFTNNTASIYGGAIYVANRDQKIISCYFDGNNASEGGAIYVVEDIVNIEIKDSTFMRSHADNGGAVYNAGSSGYNLKITNDTFIKNTAVYNGGAVLYYAQNNVGIYRDYNKFDTRGVITDGRTDVTGDDRSKTLFIETSLFEDNEDYILHIKAVSDWLSPLITITLENPQDVSRRSLKFVVNLTNATSGELIEQVVVDYENFLDHYNSELHVLYVTFPNLMIDEYYNITVGYVDENYMYKENHTQEQAHGSEIGQFQLLQKLIEEAIRNDEYELSLNRSFIFTPYSIYTPGKILDNQSINLTNIDRPFKIIGNGWTINALGYCRIFNITASNITLQNLELSGGNAGGIYNDSVNMGGAIFWSGVNGTLNRVTVYNNTATVGGGIYYNSSALDCKIINSTFVNNTAETYGGAIDCNASRMELTNTTFEYNHANIGAALCREVNATNGSGYNNTFRGNHADYGGAALAWINASSIHIDTYYFYENYAGYSGGAIYVGEGSGNCEIVNCVFDDNYVDNVTGGHGGAIEWYAEKGSVTNSSFSRNYAYDGGAIYVGSDSGKINITNSTFSENHALSTGGAVSLEASSVTVNGSNFYDNYAINGGALHVGAEGITNYVYNSIFERNKANGGIGGAINWIASSGTIVNSELTSNCADYGGGLYFGNKSSESVISNCVFTDNHAKYTGGAIDCNASKMVLTNTVFDANYAQYGAALCRDVNAKNGSGYNNTFKNNHAYVSGAALGWMGSIGITIVNYTFINNSADVSGGAIYVSPDSHNCSIENSIFENNYVTNKTATGDSEFDWFAWDGTHMYYYTAFEFDNPELLNKTDMYEDHTVFYHNNPSVLDEFLGNGGAINVLAANASIKNSNFTGNFARLGGGIYVGADSGNTHITNGVFRENEAYLRGGAVNLHASAVNVNQSKFYNNLAVNGSALYVGGMGTNNTIYSSVFDGNNATSYGGAIYWIAFAGIIDDSKFTRNSALYGGGIYFNGRSGNTNITNSSFSLNNATKNGGAIDCNASNIGIYNLTFTSNYAGEYGAALCREVGSTDGHGKNNTFTSNHAGISGAGLAWLGVKNINIDYYTFIDNTADYSGAAIYIGDDSDNCIINNSNFKGNNITNSTGGHGGAIDIIGNDATLINSNFTNNHAFYGGAIFASETSGNTNISNVIFTSNGATLDGGAVQIRGYGVSLNDTKFYSNTAVRSGGAIYVGGTGTTNTIYYSVFEDNQAGDHGGAIDWLASAGVFKYSNFTRNSAVYGGAIYLNGVSSNSNISNIIFEGNRATKNGGAIDCNASMMGLSNTQFISNYAGEYGAALCREANATGGYGGNNTFNTNHADIAGAALAWLGVDGIRINNYTFYNNTAKYSGGAIYVSEDSVNCMVSNSSFTLNYVIDVLSGKGGIINWLGDNGTIYNSTFSLSYAIEGGGLYITSDNMNITKSNFSYPISLLRGGSIVADNANNASITECIFDNSAAIGYITPEDKDFGQGGSIYWINSDNLTISNSQFNNTESHAEGAIYLLNCNNSRISNVLFNNSLSIKNGGSISWVNSTNATVDNCTFIKSEALYNGGAIYLVGMNDTIIKNSTFNATIVSKANGGAIYVEGNATIANSSFVDYSAYLDYGGAIYVHNGNSTIANSTFYGEDAIWVYRNATVNITRNNMTGLYPNEDIHYMEREYDNKYNPVDYSLWNDGTVYLEDNNFDYVIFNNGTITSQTYTYILDNKTINATWAQNFTFWATIKDDTDNNTIISVRSLNTTNDVYPYPQTPYYDLPYNAKSLNVSFQGIFHITGFDTGLKKNTVYDGTLYVLAPTDIKINVTQYNQGEKVVIQGIITKNNVPFTGNVTFKVGDDTFSRKVIDGIATLELYNLSANTYSVTALYPGDTNHFSCENSTFFIVGLRDTWIKIAIDNVLYGQLPVANITTNGNGTIIVSLNGRSERYNVVNGTYKLKFDTIYDPGIYYMSVIYIEDDYYAFETNQTSFNIYKLNTTINVNTTNITFGENEIINVTVNENASGFISLRIGTQIYTTYLNNGSAQFNISGLATGTYTANVTYYPSDNHFNRNVTTVTFKVSPTSDYTLDVKVDAIEFGQNATVRVLVPTDAKGNVTIYVDGINKGTVNVTNSTATLVVPGLAGGQHVVNVTYNGDSTYDAKDKNNTVFMVNPTNKWDMTIDAVYMPYGEYSTIYVRTSPYNLTRDNVTITIDGIDYVVPIDVNGNATLRLNNLSGGSHSGFVKYLGDANYSDLTKRFVPSIPKATPTVTLTRVGNNIIATVSGNATGTVTFNVNNVKHTVDLDGRNATLVNKLNIGTNYVTATYDGDENYTIAENIGTYEVDKFNITVELADVSDIKVDSPVTFTATLNDTVTGDVIFNINGVNYTAHVSDADVATYTYTPVNNATLTVVATFAGNDKFHSNSSASKQYTVARVSSTVGLSDVTIEVGETAVIEISVTDGATGSVNVTVNGETQTVGLVDSKATVYVFDLVNDTYPIVVKYLGDDKYDVSENTDYNVYVNKVEDFDFTVIVSDAKVGENTTVTVIVPGDADGTVTINGKSEVVHDGKAVIVLDKEVSAGDKSITVTLSGDSKYNDTSKGYTYTVDKANSNVSIGVESIYTIGDDVVIILTPVNGTATVTINDKSYTVSDNKVTFKANVTGNYKVVATVAESDNYYGSGATAVFDIVKASSGLEIEVNDVYKVGEKIVITLKPTNSTGEVTVTINGKAYTVSDNKVTIENGLANGTYTIVANLAADSNYEAAYNSTTFKVIKNDITISVDDISETIYVDGPVTITVTLNETVTGDVLFNINGANYIVSVSNANKATYTYTPVNNATLTVVATFTGNDKYNRNSSAQKQFDVNRISTDINVTVKTPVTYGDDAVITIELNVTINTTVKLRIDGNEHDVALVNGKGGYNASGLSSGSHEIAAVFAGDDKYVGSSELKTFDIANATLVADVNALNVTVEENTSFVISVPDDFKGNVSIKVGDKVLYNGTVKSLINADKLLSGSKTATAVFYGDSNYDELTLDNVDFTVSRVIPDITVTVDDVTYPNKTIAVITVGNKANGTVNITIGTLVFEGTVTNGAGSVDLTGLSAGSKVANVEFFTDDDYNDNATAGAKFTVNKANSTIVIDVEKVYLYNDTIIINLTATGSDGAVNVTINGKVYPVNADKQIVIEDIAAGEYTIIANLAANENYAAAVNSTTFKVKPAETSITIDVDSVYKVGDDIVVTLNPVNSTDLTVTINGKEYDVVNNKVTITGGLEAGDYIVNAVLAGNENYTGFNAFASFKVVKLNSTLELEVDNINVGDSEIINITLGDITAVVLVDVNNKGYYVNITNGQGQLVLDDLEAGEYKVTVKFSGDETYNANATDGSFVVSKVKDYDFDVDIAYGDNGTVILDVTLPDDATGELNITVDGKSMIVPVTNGTVSIPGLEPGKHEINVTYLGDNKYDKKSDADTADVPKWDNYSLPLITEDITYGDDETITVIVPDDATGKVNITVDGKLNEVEIKDGKAVLTLDKLSAGEHVVDIAYESAKYGLKTNGTKFNVDKSSEFEMDVEVDDNNIVVTLPDDATGNLTIMIDGEKYTVVDVTGASTSAALPKLDPGNHTIEVIYSGDDNYTQASNYTVVETPRIDDYSMNLTSEDIIEGQTEEITIELPADINGIVAVDVGGIGYYVNITNGHGKLHVAGLSAGNYIATVKYLGDNKYADLTNSTKFTVKAKQNPDIDVDIKDGSIEITLPENATGEVTVVIDGENYTFYNITEDSNRTIVVNTTGMLPGNHTVDVIYSGDDNYSNKTVSTSFEVPKVDNYDINVSAAVDGRDVTITVELPENATGLVLIDINGAGYYANVTDGKATLTIKDMANGDYEAVVTYLGDDYYASKSNSTEFTVEAKVTPVMNVDVDVLENSTDAIVNVELPEDATGNVTVVVDGKVYNVTDVAGGLTTIELNDLTPGNHTIEVIYSGDEEYTQASNYTVAEIPKITDYEFDLSAFDIKYGDNTNITVRLPDDVNGVVLIDLDGIGYYINITNGIGSLELPIDLAPGEYDVTATYKGNDKYDSKVVTDSFKVVNSQTNMTVEVKDGKVIVELPEDATGNVTITIDGKDYTAPVENGKAVLDLPELEPGDYEVVAKYPGDDKYAPATNSTSFNVPKISDYPIEIAKDDDELVVTLPEDATGNVTVTVGGKDYTVPIKDGKAIVDISDLEPGDYDAVVNYAGDDKYNPSSNSTSFNVPKISDYPIDVVQDGDELVITVLEDATGNVTVNIGGKDYTVPIENGVAKLDISDLPAGDYNAKVTYPGNDKYASKTVNANVSVTRSLVITAPDVIKYYSGPERFVIYTKDNNGNNVDNITLTITINGVPYTRVSSNGQASLALNLGCGNYTVTVDFAGNEEFKAQTVESHVEVLHTIYANDVLKVYRNDTQYWALFLDSQGNPLADTEVSFNINGVIYYRITNGTGWARLNINLQEGKYILTATNPVTGEMRSNNVTVFNLFESSDLVKHDRNDSQFVIRLRASDGNWAGAGEEVTFNINGVFYTRYSNETGHVKLNINLAPGEYIITTYYKDASKGNQVTVLPRLITSDLVMTYGDDSVFVAKTLDEKGDIAPHQEVTLNIYGIIYNLTTDNNGEAKIHINLQAGQYLITSQYLFEVQSNTVTIRE